MAYCFLIFLPRVNAIYIFRDYVLFEKWRRLCNAARGNQCSKQAEVLHGHRGTAGSSAPLLAPLGSHCTITIEGRGCWYVAQGKGTINRYGDACTIGSPPRQCKYMEAISKEEIIVS